MLRVAAVQAAAEAGAVEHNARTVARLAARAADDGARLVAFPELFLPGYAMKTLAADPDRCDLQPVGGDDVVDDPRLTPIVEVAVRTGAVVLVGASVRRGIRRTISLVMADRSGTARVVYDKQHLWAASEQALFQPGAAAATLAIDDWELALGVCYDGCFPEHGRAAALDGADVYVCPSAYLVGSEHRRDLYYAARALENTMFVVFANVVGAADGDDFNGGAAIYAPDGRPLARAADAGEEVIAADLDHTLLERVRSDHRMLADRPPALPSERRRISVS